MSIVFTDYGKSSFNTQIKNQPTQVPIFNVTSLRTTEIGFSTVENIL